MNPKNAEHRAALAAARLAEVQAVCAAVYAECTPGSAAELAPVLFKHLQLAWGGSEVYLPVFDPRPTRDVAIRAAFNGRNLVQVCQQFEVSPTTVYRVVQPRKAG